MSYTKSIHYVLNYQEDTCTLNKNYIQVNMGGFTAGSFHHVSNTYNNDEYVIMC